MFEPTALDPVFAAVDALVDAGHVVQPWGDDLSVWLVDGAALEDSDVVALATRLGLVRGPLRVVK